MNDKNVLLTRRDVLKLLTFLPMGLVADRFLSCRSKKIAMQTSSLPNVLILVLDTLSAQNMSLYGYPRETTPNITSFAEQAVVYHRHYAAGNFTTPGTGSLLTGTYPWSHRGLNVSGTLLERYEKNNLFSLFRSAMHVATYTHNALVMFLLAQMRGSIDTLIPMHKLALQENTLAGRMRLDDFAVGDWSETLIRGRGQHPSSLFFPLVEPFIVSDRVHAKEVKSNFPYGIPSANKEARYFLLEDAIDWLLSNLASLPNPFLGYFHLMPPHEPYCPREEFVGRFSDSWSPPQKRPHFFSDNISSDQLIAWRRHYDEFVAYADAEFGRLIDELERSGQLDNMILILTSDHGQLFERRIHGHITPVMYEPLLRVPLLISRPDQKKRKDVHSLTSAVDLLPSLLHIIGEPIPAWCEGKLLPGLGGKDSHDRQIFALEAKESSKWGVICKGTASVLKGPHKLIHYFGYPDYDDSDELYNLVDDPDERVNLTQTHPAVVRDLKELLWEKMIEANAWES